MAGWDEDSPQLQANLRGIYRTIAASTAGRAQLTVEHARVWQKQMMDGLDVGDEPAAVVGHFRGEPGLEDYDVIIGSHLGAPAPDVATHLGAFERELHARMAKLDAAIPGAARALHIYDVVEFAAWAHAEWVRIHPFANGNGRSARLWANAIALRYGLPAFVELRPRPEGDDYARAGALAMAGYWQVTVPLFMQYMKRAIPKQ